MVYIKHWPEYQAAALALFEASPEKTRYVFKLRPKEQWLVLKVTDDTTTLKYKTRSQAILNRFDGLTREFVARAAGAEGPSKAEQARRHIETVQGHLKQLVTNAQAGNAPDASATGAPANAAEASTAPAASSANKKKKKKGKK